MAESTTTNRGDGGSSSSAGNAPSKKEQEFRDEQKAQAALQGQPDGVPEQRPIAAQTPLDAHESQTYKDLKESGHPLASNEPMGKEAYDRAASDKQAKEAAKSSRVPTLRTGERVVITKDEPGLKGRNAVIIQTHYDDENLARFRAGGPDAPYAEPDSYIVRTRDGRTDTFELKPDEVRSSSINEGWGRGAI